MQLHSNVIWLVRYRFVSSPYSSPVVYEHTYYEIYFDMQIFCVEQLQFLLLGRSQNRLDLTHKCFGKGGRYATKNWVSMVQVMSSSLFGAKSFPVSLLLFRQLENKIVIHPFSSEAKFQTANHSMALLTYVRLSYRALYSFNCSQNRSEK